MKNINRPKSVEFRSRVDNLKCALGIENNQLSLDTVRKIESYLKDYQIMVVAPNYRITKKPIYLNEDIVFSKFLYLLLHKNHYTVLKSMSAFMKRDYFCDHCKVGYQQSKHKCEHVCQACRRVTCIREENLKCEACERDCFSKKCLDFHKTRLCANRKPCEECGYVTSAINHVCGDNEKYCYVCKESVPLDKHQCFILTEDEKAEKARATQSRFKGYIFFDFEAYEDPITLNHVVNLAVALKICVKCLDITEPSQRCLECQKFYEFYSIEEFCE